MSEIQKLQDKQNFEISKCIEALKRGSPDAQGKLVELTQSRLFRFCFYLSGNREQAQDLCQDCYLKVFKSIGDLENPEVFMSWTFRIAKNLFLDQREREDRQTPALEDDLARSLDEQPSPEDFEFALGVQQSLATLEVEDRLLLLCVDLEGLSYQEAAQVLKITEAAVRSRLHRVREKFLNHYETKRPLEPSSRVKGRSDRNPK